MATTINGVTFNMETLRPVATHRNVPNEELGSDESFINDMGYSGLVVHITGFETTLAKYDEVIAEFMKTGAQTLVYRTGWQLSIHSTRLVPLLDIGIVDNWFPYELIMITSTPYRDSTVLSCRAKEITSNNQEWSTEDAACDNLLDNWSVENWSLGDATYPDYWSGAGAGIAIAKNSTNVKVGSYSADVTRAGAAVRFSQEISWDNDYQGSTFTFGVWVRATAANTTLLQINDGVTQTESSFHTGDSTFQWLTVTKTLSAAATMLRVSMYVRNTNTTSQIDGAVLIKGSSISDSSFSRDIDTDGSVDAVPDIQVTGGTTHIGITQDTSDSNYNMNGGAVAVTISQTSGPNTRVVLIGQNRGQTINCRKAGMAVIDSVQVNVLSISVAGNVTCTVYSGVGGTLLSSKVVNITTTGVKTFTFDTPIAVVQEEETCADSTDSNKIYFVLSVTGSTHITFACDYGDPYADGMSYTNDAAASNVDLYFVINGHSVKEIRQTFTVDKTYKLSHIVLNLCKYQYAGSNPVTVTIKEGGTTLGAGTAILSGSTFTDVDFYLDEETAHSLELSASTTYTLSITPPSDSGNATAVLIKTKTTSVYANGAVTLVEDGGTTRVQTHDIYFKLYFAHSNEDIQIYNTADTTTKCDVANQILEGAIHIINVDGTGTIDFDDDFTTGKYATTNEGMSGVTHDTGNDELDIADDGYVYWKCDAKGVVSGIPTLTSRINITAGAPTIQISIDASTWYDITTAIVDDVDTEYELDSASLSLKGETLFYWRYDCVKAAAATCSVKSFELDVEMHTIDFEHPKISESGVSTFRCDQDADSGITCEVSLIYRDRSWVG